MNEVIPSIRRYFPYFILITTSFALFFCAGAEDLVDFFETEPTFWYHFSIGLSWAFQYFYYRAFTLTIRTGDSQTIVLYATRVIMAASLVLFGAGLHQWMPDLFFESAPLQTLLLILTGGILLFMTLLLRRMILVGSNRFERIGWKIFQALILFIAFIGILKLPPTPKILWMGLIISSLPALFLALQYQWIIRVPVDFRRSLFVVLLAGCSLIILVFFQMQFWVDPLERFGIWLTGPLALPAMLMIFLSTAALSALFRLSTSLPLFHLLDSKNQEIQTLLKISQTMDLKEETSVWEVLLEDAYRDSKANAAHLAVLNNDGQEEYIIRKNIEPYACYELEWLLDSLDWEVHNGISVGSFQEDDWRTNQRLPVPFRSMLTFKKPIAGQRLLQLTLLYHYIFSHDKQVVDLLISYLQLSASALTHIQTFHESIKAAQIRQEYTIAGQIQSSLLPGNYIKTSHFELSVYFDPSVEVGGDFYEYYQTDSGKWVVVVGDVAGKGMPAALYMAQLKGIFRSLRHLSLSPSEWLEKVNQAVGECFAPQIFVALTFVVIDPEIKTLWYARAGMYPLLWQDAQTGETSALDDMGMGLGILRNHQFQQHIHIYERRFNAGDGILIFTDGCIEAKSEMESEMYGIKRLKESFHRQFKLPGKKALEKIVLEFKTFVKFKHMNDDITCLMIRFLK